MFNRHHSIGYLAGQSAIALAGTVGLGILAAQPSLAASFRYTTLTNEAVFAEGETVVEDLTYDGTFTNTVFNPFSGLEQTFSGLYQIQSGRLGAAVFLSAVQQNPTDRTGLGSDGTTRIEYLDTPQQVTTVPGAFSIPPGLTEFDFKFVPATVAGAPVVVSKGWTVSPVSESTPKSVPEPSAPVALLALSGLALLRPKQLSKRILKQGKQQKQLFRADALFASGSTAALLLGSAVAGDAIFPRQGFAIASQPEAISFITNRADLNATDQVDWSTLGPVFNPFGPPDPAVFLPSVFTATSQAGSSVQVSIPEATVPGVLPPFVFQTTPEPGIATNFGNGDFVLFTGLIPGPPPAVGNPGPITLTFDDPIFGAGTQLAVDDIFNFTGTISAFDSNNQLLGSFSAPGTSSLNLDNSALFLGISAEEPTISKLEFTSSVPSSAIGLNQLSLLTRLPANKADVPEPSVLLALSIVAAFMYTKPL